MIVKADSNPLMLSSQLPPPPPPPPTQLPPQPLPHDHHQRVLTSLPLKNSETYVYYFDTPNLGIPGTVSVHEHLVVISFPKFSSQSVIADDVYFQYNQKSVQLTINNKVSFDTAWIPIYSEHDWYRINDMFCCGYNAYLKKTRCSWTTELGKHHAYVHHEKKSRLGNEIVSIQSTETLLNTSINLTIMQPMVAIEEEKKEEEEKVELNNKEMPVHVKIYFGDDLFVCTKSMLPHLQMDTVHALLSFMLLKLVKW